MSAFYHRAQYDMVRDKRLVHEPMIISPTQTYHKDRTAWSITHWGHTVYTNTITYAWGIDNVTVCLLISYLGLCVEFSTLLPYHKHAQAKIDILMDVATILDRSLKIITFKPMDCDLWPLLIITIYNTLPWVCICVWVLF